MMLRDYFNLRVENLIIINKYGQEFLTLLCKA